MHAWNAMSECMHGKEKDEMCKMFHLKISLFWYDGRFICVYVYVCKYTEDVLQCAFMCERIEKNFRHVLRSRLYNVHRSYCAQFYVPKSNKQSVVMATNTFYDSLHRNSSEMMRAVYLRPTKHIRISSAHRHNYKYVYWNGARNHIDANSIREWASK